jgi:hypothetical protein
MVNEVYRDYRANLAGVSITGSARDGGDVTALISLLRVSMINGQIATADQLTLRLPTKSENAYHSAQFGRHDASIHPCRLAMRGTVGR